MTYPAPLLQLFLLLLLASPCPSSPRAEIHYHSEFPKFTSKPADNNHILVVFFHVPYIDPSSLFTKAWSLSLGNVVRAKAGLWQAGADIGQAGIREKLGLLRGGKKMAFNAMQAKLAYAGAVAGAGAKLARAKVRLELVLPFRK